MFGNAIKQSIPYWPDYFKSGNFKAAHRLNSAYELIHLQSLYDFFILDRDGTLQPYHATQIASDIEVAVRAVSNKAEILSNSTYDEMRRIRDIWGDIIPVSKLVRFYDGGDKPFLLRFAPDLKVYRYEPPGFVDVSLACDSESECGPKISYDYNKPDPLTIRAVLDFNRKLGRMPTEGKAIMVGDRWLTDIVAANLAGIDSAKVRSYMPFSDPLVIILTRYLLENPLAWSMDRIRKAFYTSGANT